MPSERHDARYARAQLCPWNGFCVSVQLCPRCSEPCGHQARCLAAWCGGGRLHGLWGQARGPSSSSARASPMALGGLHRLSAQGFNSAPCKTVSRSSLHLTERDAAAHTVTRQQHASHQQKLPKHMQTRRPSGSAVSACPPFGCPGCELSPGICVTP